MKITVFDRIALQKPYRNPYLHNNESRRIFQDFTHILLHLLNLLYGIYKYTPDYKYGIIIVGFNSVISACRAYKSVGVTANALKRERL